MFFNLKKSTPLQTVGENIDVLVIDSSKIHGGIAKSAFIQLSKSWAFSGTTLIDSFYQECVEVGVEFSFNNLVTSIFKKSNGLFEVTSTNEIYEAEYVVIATGIMNYSDFMLSPQKTNIALHTSQELIKEINCEYGWKSILVVGNYLESINRLKKEIENNFELVKTFKTKNNMLIKDLKLELGSIYDSFDGILFDYNSYKIQNGTTDIIKKLNLDLENGYIKTNKVGKTKMNKLYAVGTVATPVSGILAATYTAELAAFAIGRQIVKYPISDSSGRFPFLPKEEFWEIVKNRYE